MTERQLFEKMKAGLPMVEWLRVENAVGAGMFDVNGCHDGVEFWVELKVDAHPKLRRAQVAWAMARYSHGARLFVLTHHWLHTSLSIHRPPFNHFKPLSRGYVRLMNDAVHVETGIFDWKKILNIFCENA